MMKASAPMLRKLTSAAMPALALFACSLSPPQFAGVLLIASWSGSLAAARSGNMKATEFHDTRHPLVLKNEADFLAALIVLYDESLQASLAVAIHARRKVIKDHAAKSARAYRSELPKLRALLARHQTNTKPDFHYQDVMPKLTTLSGPSAEKYYLSGFSNLLAAQIELAELASGIVQSEEIKTFAGKVIEKRSTELSILSRWLDSYQAP